MKSNYKRLGDYIVPCDEKNTGNIIKKLQGISNQKYFQKSHTNTIGVDLEKYRIVRTGQFAFNRATTRNGEKISIALRQGKDCIVSPSYRIFKSKDENVLNSEYLMMWFKRPEFDRFARFKSHGSAHEFFDYGEMCEVELPIPNIEKQREIVREYNIIQNRIALNNQLISKLEETAQAIYKQWFVDFEFPDENGKPYKSNDGKMVWCEELEKEIPEGWELIEINKLGHIKHGYAFKGENFVDYETENVLISPGNFKINGGFNFEKNKFYNGIFPEDYILIEDELIFNMTDLSKKGDTLGNSALVPKISFKKLLHNQRVGKFESKNKEINYFLYFSTNESNYKQYILGTATGTTVRHTSPTRIAEFKLLVPENEILNRFNKTIEPFVKLINLNISSEYKLKELRELLLTKITRVEN